MNAYETALEAWRNGRQRDERTPVRDDYPDTLEGLEPGEVEDIVIGLLQNIEVTLELPLSLKYRRVLAKAYRALEAEA